MESTTVPYRVHLFLRNVRLLFSLSRSVRGPVQPGLLHHAKDCDGKSNTKRNIMCSLTLYSLHSITYSKIPLGVESEENKTATFTFTQSDHAFDTFRQDRPLIVSYTAARLSVGRVFVGHSHACGSTARFSTVRKHGPMARRRGLDTLPS